MPPQRPHWCSWCCPPQQPACSTAAPPCAPGCWRAPPPGAGSRTGARQHLQQVGPRSISADAAHEWTSMRRTSRSSSSSVWHWQRGHLWSISVTVLPTCRPPWVRGFIAARGVAARVAQAAAGGSIGFWAPGLCTEPHSRPGCFTLTLVAAVRHCSLANVHPQRMQASGAWTHGHSARHAAVQLIRLFQMLRTGLSQPVEAPQDLPETQLHLTSAVGT